jgi:hypothetical protein
MRHAAYSDAAERLRRALAETPGMATLEAIELLEQEAAEQRAAYDASRSDL